MTSVFFLFLSHSSLGLLTALPLVPEGAGAKFFKFCSAAAAFMSTAGLWLLYRRYGLDAGPETLGGARYPVLMLAAGASLVFTIFYNRSEHFGWKQLRAPSLWAAILSAMAALAAGAPADGRAAVWAADFSSALLIGGSAGAMILGHWYLVVLDLPISALRRLTVLLVVGLVLRTLTVGLALFGPEPGALHSAGEIAAGLWSPDGIFVWMRLLFGIAGPWSLIVFIWKTVEIRSTQSATGILYVQLFMVMAGELLAKYLRVAAGLAL